MWKQVVRAFALVLAASLFAAACGSGSGGSTPTATSDDTESDSSESSGSSASSDSGNSLVPDESPIADLLGIPIGSDDEMEDFFAQLSRDAERKISECMLAQGFEYTPVNYDDLGGVDVSVDQDSKEFVEEYGFGVASNPFEEAFESFENFVDPNQEYIETLSEGEADAYNLALRGADTETFEPGGCQGDAFEEAFAFGSVFEQFGDQFEEIGDAFEADPRIVEATSGWAECMREAGYTYDDTDDAEADIRSRYNEITSQPGAFVDEGEGAATIEVESSDGEDFFTGFGTLTPEVQAEVDALIIEEKAVALAAWDCEAPLREIQDGIQVEYEQKFVDQYGAEVRAALGE